VIQSEGGLDELRNVLLWLECSDTAAEGEREEREVAHICTDVNDQRRHAAFSCSPRQNYYQHNVTEIAKKEQNSPAADAQVSLMMAWNMRVEAGAHTPCCMT
jgi:hypothetical protein